MAISAVNRVEPRGKLPRNTCGLAPATQPRCKVHTVGRVLPRHCKAREFNRTSWLCHLLAALYRGPVPPSKGLVRSVGLTQFFPEEWVTSGSPRIGEHAVGKLEGWLSLPSSHPVRAFDEFRC